MTIKLVPHGLPFYCLPVQAGINFTLSLDAIRKRAYFTPNVRAQAESFTLNQTGRCFTYRVVIEVRGSLSTVLVTGS